MREEEYKKLQAALADMPADAVAALFSAISNGAWVDGVRLPDAQFAIYLAAKHRNLLEENGNKGLYRLRDHGNG